MPSLYQTAYPRLKHNPTQRDLDAVYTPTRAELGLASSVAHSDVAKLGFLVTLKTFQRLGYFVYLRDIPEAITEHIVRCLGFLFVPVNILSYDQAGTRWQHIKAIRIYQRVTPYSQGGQEIVEQATRRAAQTREDVRDLVNAAIEELARRRTELPSFDSLVRIAKHVRAEVNRELQQRVFDELRPEDHARLEQLILAPEFGAGPTAWQRIKHDPGKATLTNLRNLVQHHAWLSQQQLSVDVATLLPEAKLRHFAEEAESLNVSRLQQVEPVKRGVLAATLLHTRSARVLDDLGELLIKRMASVHSKGKEALDVYRREHQGRTDALILTLKEMLTAYKREGDDSERLGAIGQVVDARSDALLEQCEEHGAYADNNYLPFLWRYYASHRPTLFRLCRVLPLRVTSQVDSFMAALAFLLEHEKSHATWLPLQEPGLDLAWVSPRWWPLVTGEKRRTVTPEQVNRRHFEICVFSQLMWDLKSGDVCIDGSLEFADYRAQLISDVEYEALVKDFGLEVGLPTEPKAFVAQTRSRLEAIADTTDHTFPANKALRIENGQPVLRRFSGRRGKRTFERLEKALRARFDTVPILDVLADTENLLGWTQFFGPLTGFEAKMDNPTERYLQATFCYGCNIGPSQTARSLAGAERKGIAWVNKRHVRDEDLERATTHLINGYNRFTLPKLWGTGKSVSADGMKWDVYEQNLLAEYHIRYGGYGGIGYYHVSDTYIALFSRFIPCGVYEAVHILDGLLENESDIQPDTVHSDTHGQNAPVFGLAHLLGIELMPRIRDWKDLTFVKADKSIRYTHIDALFTDTVDWYLIERHLPDMLRVVLSIKAGRVSAATILKRLSSYSRKNRVYQAFRELGRVIRTGFLLRYVADGELRSTIQSAINKSEQFNAFLKWVAFGGDELRTNNRDLQQKIVKYNHLVANCLIYYNVMTLTRVIKEFQEEGHDVPDDALARLNPYMTEHINRLGEYHLDLSRVPPEPIYDFRPFSEEASEQPISPSR